MDDQQQNGFDHSADSTGPETDENVNPTEGAPGAGDKPRAPAGREMLIQLQQMIDTIALQAAPVIREVGAKAAELAAEAASMVGPAAHRAADVTEDIGQRVAGPLKEIAADLRRQSSDAPASEGDTETPSSDNDQGSEPGGGMGAPGI